MKLRSQLAWLACQLRELLRLWPLLLALVVGVILPLTASEPMALDTAVAWFVILAASLWLAGQDGFLGSLSRRYLGTRLWTEINETCMGVFSRLLGAGRLVGILCSAVSSYTALIASLLFERWLGNGRGKADGPGQADHPITPDRIENTDLEGE